MFAFVTIVPVFHSSEDDDDEETVKRVLPANPTPNDWIDDGDLGGAAVTIWCVMTGNIRDNGVYSASDGNDYKYTIPKHTGSFYRCYKLLKLFPKWQTRLSEVVKAFPEWQPFVRDWGSLIEIVEQNPMSKEDSSSGADYHNEQLRVALLNLYRESQGKQRTDVHVENDSPRGMFSGFSQIMRDMKSKEK
jgi:hypothetical protein